MIFPVEIERRKKKVTEPDSIEEKKAKEVVRVTDHRLHDLMEAGFPLKQAERLAPRTPGAVAPEEVVDLREATSLLKRIKANGHSTTEAAELAYRILR